MSGIVCGIRGGPDSRPTIQRAITLARETDLPIIFLYVVNLDFLTHTSTSRVDTVTAELEQMGEFILLTAEAEAQSSGVNAIGVIRHGNVGEEIIALCQDEDAEYIVLGRPSGQAEEDVFTHEIFERFKDRIESETEARVVVAEDETR